MSCLPFHAIGIDVGGTKIAAGLVSFPEGEIFSRQIVPTSPHRGGQAVLDDAVRLAEVLAKTANAQGMILGGIGLGLCELIDPDGHIFSSHSIQLQEQSIVERLSHFAPIVLEADVRSAALAEAMFGAGRSLRIFLYVTIGTGISSCLMIEGRPFLGAHGATGTMASGSIETACERCGHVTRGTLEEVASGPALVARFHQHRPGMARTGQEVLAAAGAGDAQAFEVVHSAGRAVGTMVGFLVNVLDPEAVIVGGGVGLAEGPYWESLVQSARRVIYSDHHRTIPVVHALTGENAGLVGAAATVWKRFAPGHSPAQVHV